MRWYRKREHGQTLAWVAVFLPALLIVLGLVIDGGLAFDARRNLQNVADAAAQAGAMQLDTTTYAATDQLQLDPVRARAAAEGYLRPHPGLTARVTIGPTWVQVAVRERWPTIFLRLFGVGTVTMDASATAHARIGH